VLRPQPTTGASHLTQVASMHAQRQPGTSIADYLVHAWNHCNVCKHSGAVLPPPSAPVGRGADGDVAMA
jgi:hypothetical protein